MEAFLVSTGVVALGEMGDKTQLLAIVLATTFRKPIPIILGIFVATVLNHAAAGALGGWVAQALGPELLRWIVGLSFIAMAGWMLIPDKLDDDVGKQRRQLGVFGTTVLAFFLAEMGDKTQIATVALATRYAEVMQVVLGTTFGMMLANVPAGVPGRPDRQEGVHARRARHRRADLRGTGAVDAPERRQPLWRLGVENKSPKLAWASRVRLPWGRSHPALGSGYRSLACNRRQRSVRDCSHASGRPRFSCSRPARGRHTSIHSPRAFPERLREASRSNASRRELNRRTPKRSHLRPRVHPGLSSELCVLNRCLKSVVAPM